MSGRQLAAFVLSLVVLAMPTEVALADDDWFGFDKALHVGAGAGVATVSYAALSLLPVEAEVRFALSLGAGALAGVTKELVDLTGAGTPSAPDVVMTVFGAFLGAVVAYAIDKLIAGGRVSRAGGASVLRLEVSAL